MAKIKRKLKIKQEKKLRIKKPETEEIKKQNKIRIDDELPEEIIDLKTIKLPEEDKDQELENIIVPQHIQNLEEDLENVPEFKSTESKYDSNKSHDYDSGPSTYQVQNFNDPKNRDKKYKRKEDKMY